MHGICQMSLDFALVWLAVNQIPKGPWPIAFFCLVISPICRIDEYVYVDFFFRKLSRASEINTLSPIKPNVRWMYYSLKKVLLRVDRYYFEIFLFYDPLVSFFSIFLQKLVQIINRAKTIFPHLLSATRSVSMFGVNILVSKSSNKFAFSYNIKSLAEIFSAALYFYFCPLFKGFRILTSAFDTSSDYQVLPRLVFLAPKELVDELALGSCQIIVKRWAWPYESMTLVKIHPWLRLRNTSPAGCYLFLISVRRWRVWFCCCCSLRSAWSSLEYRRQTDWSSPSGKTSK